MTGPYRRPLGFLHDRGIREEIAGLDTRRDCQRIVYLLVSHEFPFDLERALELALFHTYGSRSVARLLERTGEFTKRGQKRYDDTKLLIAYFLEHGWDGPLGQRAIDRMNAIHAHYRIPNDDYLFVLWTFIDFPFQWTDEFGWRSFTPHEKQAWFHYWREVGRRMGIRSIPASKEAFDQFVEGYEEREMVPNPASKRVADATIAIMEAWLPRPLRPLVRPVAACLVRPRFASAAGFPEPGPLWRYGVRAALKLRAAVKSVVSIERYARPIAEMSQRTYPGARFTIDELGPERMRARAFN